MDSKKLKTRLAIVVTLVVLVACSVYLFKDFEWKEALEIALNADLWIFGLGACASIVSFWIMRSLRWAVMLSIFGYKDFRFSKIYIATAYSIGLLMVMPLQAGEALKVEMLRKAGGLSRSDGYFALAIERLLDICVVLFVTLLCVSIAAFEGEAVTSALSLMGVLLGGCLVVYVVFHFFAPDIAMVQEVKRRVNKLWQNPGSMFQSLLYTFLGWSCVAFGWWTTLRSVGIYLNPVDVTGLTTGMTLVNVVSFVPGSVGVSEVGISLWLEYLGFDRAEANAGALMLRAYGLSLLVLGVLHWAIVKALSWKRS